MQKALATAPGEPTQYLDLTTEEITQRQQEENLPPAVSLSSKLLAVYDTLPLEVQADFSPLRAAVQLELEQSRSEVARLIIERANIPEELEIARQALLAQFDPA